MARKPKAKPQPEPEMYTIYADILQETEATDEHDGAILIDCGDSKGIWLPISQVQYNGERGDTGVPVTLPDWLADENGLFDGQGGEANTQETQQAEGSGVDTATDTEEDISTHPENLSFNAEVTKIDKKQITLLVVAGDENMECAFGKDELHFDGDDQIDLQVGYTGIEFSVAWDRAVECGLVEFLGADVPVVDAAVSRPEEGSSDSQTEEAPVRETSPPNGSYLRKETITAVVKLTEEEKNQVAQRAFDAMAKRAELKEEAARYSQLAKGKEKEHDKLAKIFREGTEERRIDCDVIADYDAGTAVYVERGWPHREIKRVKLTEKDLQLKLPLEDAAPAHLAETAQDEQLTEPTAKKIVKISGTVVAFYDGGVEIEFDGVDGTFLMQNVDFTFEGVLEIGESAVFSVAHSVAVEIGLVEAPQPEGIDFDAEVAADDAGAEDAPQDEEQERSCGTCAHAHDVPSEDDEENPCTECAASDYPNYVAVTGEGQAEAVQ